ncbi:YdcF family protein [Sulfurimonas sp. MAG313]|nr:ElyC/SanA/YdcF family protein [Sulfurimonas sp. MAG313]MDF1881151.1 YdcF family protein [Sulfurimonas sp. MAG313]
MASLIVIVLLVINNSDAILKAYANAFRIDNATKGADCVLILSGNYKTRPDHAAMLMQENYSNRLYHTDQRQEYSKHYEIFGYAFEKAQKVLATYSLSADIIPSIKGGATSTFDEAHDFVAFLKEHPMKHVILVTDAFHTARAHYAFRKILDLNGYKDIIIEMSAASNNAFTESTWYKTERGVSAYILEPIKYLFYIFHTTNTTLVKEN